MVHHKAKRIGASMLAICLATSGCSMLGAGQRAALASDQVPARSQTAAREKAVRAALARNDFATALQEAEGLVEAEPRNADFRSLLGQAYLLNGQYVSARSAYSDALGLGANDRRTVVSLAMIETALGHGEVARAVLNDHAGSLSAADLGLALALAGDPAGGVRVLGQAVQETGGDARLRQNFAYALALAGDWTQARLVASRDLSAAEVQERISRWAILARAGNEELRVATLLGVSPRGDDAGMPARLALAAPSPADPATGTATPPVSLAAMTPGQRADEPSVPGQSAAPLFVSPLRAPAPKAAPTPVPRLATAPVATIRPVASFAAQPRKLPAGASAAFVHTPAPAGRTAFISQSMPGKGSPAASRFLGNSAPAPAAARAGSGNWSVQLGAFSDVTGAMVRWQQFASRDAALGRLPVVASLTESNGARLTRLSIRGFASRDAAMVLCGRLRGAGQACFPREGD